MLIGNSSVNQSPLYLLADLRLINFQIRVQRYVSKNGVNKKRVENFVADHLSRMQYENPQELPIDDSLRDDMLYRINRSDPWYTDIVNLMVTGYVPRGGNKRKLIHESRSHIWDAPYLFRVCSDGLLRRCVLAKQGIKIIER